METNLLLKCASTQPKIINWGGMPTRLQLLLQVLPRAIASLAVFTAQPSMEMQLHKLSASRLIIQAVALMFISCTMPRQASSQALKKEVIKSWLSQLVVKEIAMLNLTWCERLSPTLQATHSLVSPTLNFTLTPTLLGAMLPFVSKRME